LQKSEFMDESLCIQYAWIFVHRLLCTRTGPQKNENKIKNNLLINNGD